MSDIEKMPLTSMDVTAERIEKLKAIFPEAFVEGKVDHDALLRSLGQWVEPGKERFGLNWPGKADCMKVIQTPSVGTLLPMRDESVNFDSTENLIIEGDNLEVLKLLQKSYFGKIRMIYIDPPYNTGKEFIYPDNYSETLKVYLQYSGQIDSEGRKFSTNTDSEGRFHSKWLSMMYPRIFLARNLLKDDGVIFISIGDDEVSNLKKICDDIFGEENFISTISRVMKSGGAKGNFFTPNIDFVLVYAKNILSTKYFRARLTKDQINTYYNKVESEGERKGELYGEERLYKASLDPRANQRYWIECPDGSFVIPPGVNFPETIRHGSKIKPTSEDGVWKWILETYNNEFKKGNIIFKETTTSALIDENGKISKWNIYNKLWLKDQIAKGVVPSNFIANVENRQSSAELKLLDINFDFAKPVNLIKYLIEISQTSEHEIILDFFGGSATTAHSIFEINNGDCANLKFILVQLPEPCDEDSEAFKAGFKTISDIGKERIRRVIKQMNEADANKLDLEGIAKQNRGFKSLKLSSSNFKVWEGDVAGVKNVAETLSLFAQNIIPGRSSEDILYELLLKAGFPLTAPVEKLSLAGKDVYSIAEGALLICLDKELTIEVIEAMVEREPSQILCLDEGFKGNDQLKVNAVQTVKSRNRNEEADIVFRVV